MRSVGRLFVSWHVVGIATSNLLPFLNSVDYTHVCLQAPFLWVFLPIHVKCFHGCPTVEESSAFMFCSSMKVLKDSPAGNTVLHRLSSHSKTRVMPCQPWENPRSVMGDLVSIYRINFLYPFREGSCNRTGVLNSGLFSPFFHFQLSSK